MPSEISSRQSRGTNTTAVIGLSVIVFAYLLAGGIASYVYLGVDALSGDGDQNEALMSVMRFGLVSILGFVVAEFLMTVGTLACAISLGDEPKHLAITGLILGAIGLLPVIGLIVMSMIG